jgi:hypothetical protein
MPRYFVTPNYSVAFIPKSGCSTLSRATVKSFQPDDEAMVQGAAYPDGKHPDNSMLQWLANVETEPTKPVLAFVRDPLSRFLSAMGQMRFTDVEATITAMEQEVPVTGVRGRQINVAQNPHFKPQYLWLTPTARLYRFPDHLTEGATEVGFILPLPTINPASGDKPVPTQEQEARILSWYAADLDLYESITSAGVVLQDVLGSDWLSSHGVG